MEIASLDQLSKLNSVNDNNLRKTAEEFEAVFLKVMLSSAFQGLSDDGFIDDKSTDTWRDMQIEHMSRSIAESGGLGLSDAIYQELLSMQENGNTR